MPVSMLHGPRKPTVSVCITTRNSADRLENLLREVACFADETVIGVDDRSTDGTWEIAQQAADVTYRFRMPAHMAPVRMLPFEYATGDWILSLDDDEGLEDSFDDLLPDLLATPGLTHWWFPRKALVSYEPFRYACDPHWNPDWQLRLFRNNAALVWKPPRYHSGYFVMGPGGRECRTSLLHFDHLLRSHEEREAKYRHYREGGSVDFNEATDRLRHESLTAVATPRTRKKDLPLRPKRVDQVTRTPDVAQHPPWKADFLDVSHPRELTPGARLAVQAHIRNTGRLDWHPSNGRWPQLRLTYHLLDAAGSLVQFENSRDELPHPVPSGSEAWFGYFGLAPSQPGDYLLEWDMVSEGECWFADCGATTLRTPLRVLPSTGQRPPDIHPTETVGVWCKRRLRKARQSLREWLS